MQRSVELTRGVTQVVSICAGNNLHGDAFVRLYGSLGNAVSNTVGPLN